MTIATSNADGSMKPFRETLGNLRDAFSKMTDEEKVANAEALVGREAMSGLLAIVNASEDDYIKLTDAINDANGAAQEQADIMQDNLKGALTILGSAAEGLGIQIYEGIKEPLREIVEEATGMVDSLSKAFTQGGMEGLVDEVGNILSRILTKIASSAPKMITAGTKLLTSLLTGLSKNTQKISKATVDVGKALVKAFTTIVPQMGKMGLKLITELAKSMFGYGIGKKVGTLCDEIVSAVSKLADKAAGAFGKIQDLLKNVAGIMLDVATKAVSVLADTLGFLMDHCDVLIPVIGGLIAAVKTFAIVDTISKSFQAAALAVDAYTAAQLTGTGATVAATGALTIKEGLVGVLTGKKGLATAAQSLWNAAMSANPIGLVITGVAALAAGIGVLCLMQEQEQSSAEKLEETYLKMGDSLGEIGSAAAEYYDGISTAGNILDDFNTSVIVSKEKQQELASKMDEVQGQITEIARNASDQRRAMTDEEIQKLDELFEQMRNLAKVELEIQQQYQQTVMDQAELFVETFDGTLEEYEAGSQRFINSAEETRQEVLAKAQSQYEEETTLIRASMDAKNTLYSEGFMAEREQLQTHLADRGALFTESYQTELAELRARHEEAGTLDSESYQEEYDALTQTFSERGELYTSEYEAELEKIRKRHADEKTLYSEAYNEEVLAAQESYNAAVEAANKKCADTLKIVSDGYEDQSSVREIFERGEKETNSKTEEESRRHKEALGKIAQDRKTFNERYREENEWDTKNFNRRIEKENEDYANNLERINAEWLANLDKDSQDQLGIWMNNLANTELYGGEISDENQAMVDRILEAYEKLPEESKKNMQSTMDGMLVQMEKDEPSLYSKATSIASGILSKLKKAFKIQSPSKETRAIFKNVMAGAEEGMDDETPKLYRQTEMVSKGVLGKFDGSMSALVDKMKAAVSAERFRTSLGPIANASYMAAASSTQAIQPAESSHGPILVEAHVQLGDATELAVALTPAIEKEMAFGS